MSRGLASSTVASTGNAEQGGVHVIGRQKLHGAVGRATPSLSIPDLVMQNEELKNSVMEMILYLIDKIRLDHHGRHLQMTPSMTRPESASVPSGRPTS